MAVVGRGREKQPVLESRRHQPQRSAEFAVFAKGGRHQVVALVHDEQVPRQVGRPFGRLTSCEELLAHIRLAEVVIRSDDAAERTPGVGVHAEPPLQPLGALPVHDLEAQRELFPEFVPPLLAQRGGRENQNALNAPSQEQLGEDQTGLDGLPETHVVGDQQFTRGIRSAFRSGTS